MNIGGLIGRAAALVQSRGAGVSSQSVAEVSSSPDPDAASSWTAGPPGWIYPGALSCVEVYARIMAGSGSASWLTYLDKIGNTTVALLGVMLGSLLTYRGWHGHVRARVQIAQAQAAALGAVSARGTQQAQQPDKDGTA